MSAIIRAFDIELKNEIKVPIDLHYPNAIYKAVSPCVINLNSKISVPQTYDGLTFIYWTKDDKVISYSNTIEVNEEGVYTAYYGREYTTILLQFMSLVMNLFLFLTFILCFTLIPRTIVVLLQK